MDKNDKIIEIDEFEVTNKKNNAQSEKDLTLNEMKQRLGIKHIMKREDFFAFDGHKCLTHCDGHCCSNREISLSTYDIFKIVTSPIGIRLGLTDTTKLFMHHPSFAVIYLGDQSGMPQASLDFRATGRYRNICPFAQIVYTKQFHFKLECGIHDVKPLTCKLSPLGRLKVLNSAENHFFIHKPTDGCCCVNSSQRVRITDYIRDYGLGDYLRNRDLVADLYSLLVGTLSEFKLLAGHIMFNFDGILFLSQGLDPNTVRPRNFNQLIRKIKETIIGCKKYYLNKKEGAN